MGKNEFVVDTNVPLTANCKADQADATCVDNCVQVLNQFLLFKELALLDKHGEIYSEYLKKLEPSGQPGVGYAFMNWLSRYRYHPDYCREVATTPNCERGFEEFPDDPRLEAFDRDDRKFVAVALASGSSPQVLNAVDGDWWDHRKALAENGVDVVFLCPELMRRNR